MDPRECHPPMLMSVSSASVIEYTQLTRICRLSSCFNHSESTIWPKNTTLMPPGSIPLLSNCKLTPSPSSYNPGVRAISLDHKDRIPESSMENERPMARSIYSINIHNASHDTDCSPLSPKALFQRLGMHGARIHNSDVKLVSSHFSQKRQLTSSMNCGSLLPRASP